MKIRIKKVILIQALTFVSSITQKTNESILNTSLFETKENELIIKATNYEVSFSGSFPALIEKEGSICLNTSKLLAIIRNTEAEEITLFKTDNNWITVEYAKANFKLSGIEASEYPEIQFDELENQFLLSSDKIKQIITQLSFAIGDNEARRNLMGLNLKIQNNKLHWTGADSFRVSYTSLPIPKENLEDTSIIIPRQSLHVIKQILNDIIEDVAISFDNNNFQITVNGLHFRSKLINGEYPNLTTLLEKKNPNSITIPCRSLKQIVQQMQALSDKQPTVVIKLTIDNNKLVIETQKLETGEGKDEIDIAYEGEPTAIGINTKFLLDIVHVIETAGEENLTMSFEGSLNPIIFSTPEWKDFISLLMPVKIKW